jgi:hypothetical protein
MDQKAFPAGDGAFDQATEAFAGVFVDDGEDLDRPAVGGGVDTLIDQLDRLAQECGYPAVLRCDPFAGARPCRSATTDLSWGKASRVAS